MDQDQLSAWDDLLEAVRGFQQLRADLTHRRDHVTAAFAAAAITDATLTRQFAGRLAALDRAVTKVQAEAGVFEAWALRVLVDAGQRGLDPVYPTEAPAVRVRPGGATPG